MRHLLPALFLAYLCFACTRDRATQLLDPVAHEWVFDLENEVDTTKRFLMINPGDRLTTDGDTISILNDYSGWTQKFRHVTRGEQPDSSARLVGLVLAPQADSALLVQRYHEDSLQEQWRFHLPRTKWTPVAEGAIKGQTFRCKFPDTDTLQVYFGYGDFLNIGGISKEYYLPAPNHFFEPLSKTWSSNMGWNFSYFSPTPLRGGKYFVFRKGKQEGFGRYSYRFGTTAGGQLQLGYLQRVRARHKELRLPLVPVPSVVPADVSIETFCARVNSGVLQVDQSYPSIDSADVSFAYAEDALAQGVLEVADLDRLEFNLNTNGEYFLLAGDRLIRNGRWEFSPDRNYIITLGEKGNKLFHFPIVNYNDDYLALRLPLKVKTREPRGVRLDSYGLLDAYVRIENR